MKNQVNRKNEKLRIQSSVYPEGYGTMEHYNSFWQEVHNKVFKMYRERNLEERAKTFNLN